MNIIIFLLVLAAIIVAWLWLSHEHFKKNIHLLKVEEQDKQIVLQTEKINKELVEIFENFIIRTQKHD